MIFISYRIADSEDIVRRLDDSLTRSLGENAVFLDKTRISGGADWTQTLEINARNRPIMLVMIGPQWQKVKYEDGDLEGFPRLSNPEDWVRKEITFALQEQRTVIPVLINGTTMPPAGWLEQCQLGDLAKKQGVELSSSRYDHDFARLLETLRNSRPDLFQSAAAVTLSETVPHGPESEVRWLKPYLEWVVAMHGRLDLPGVRGATQLPVRLEQVFVALRGDRAGAFEIAQSHELLEDDLAGLHAAYHELSDTERRWLRACLLRQNPYMLSLLERDRPAPAVGSGHAIPVTLGEAFRNERWLVILGDPGSGKTTLGRWIALKLAVSMLSGEQGPVRVPAYQVNPETPYDHRPVELGPTRLPILLRVAKFAQALARAREQGKATTLIDWLCEITWNEQPPTSGDRIPAAGLDRLFRSFLRDGQAVLILDGLDEITEAVDRADVVRAVEQFVRDWITASGSPAHSSAGRGGEALTPAVSLGGPPHEAGGNQLVVTSRIAGYHAAPLTAATMTHVTIEPMRRPAVEHFCEMWMQAVHELLEPGLLSDERNRRAREMAGGLKQAIFNPERPGIAEIASNPLLVTILASLYLKHGSDLPGTRVELYQTAIEMLIDDWRDTPLSLEETLYVLDPLAAYIHERHPTGLVEENELRAVVTEHLAVYRGLPAENPPPRLAADVRMFVQTMRDRVGLIASRGERLYGFLHLTFQEHLAGRRLVRNPQSAADEIIGYMSDPRWREPILLALGYAVWKWTPAQRGDLLNRLLSADDPLGLFLPRSALFVVDALSDTANIPEPSFRLLVRRLLSAYADRETGERFPALRKRVEEAFLRLRRMGRSDWMDEVLAEAIRSPTPEDNGAAVSLAGAAAALVREHEWFSSAIVEALVDGLENDSEAWGWPVEESLRDLVSPEIARVVPTPVAPDADLRKAEAELRDLESQPDTPESEARRAALLDELDREQAALQQLQREASRDYERTVTRYPVAVAAEERVRLRESLRERVPLPVTDLRLRRALESDGALFERVLTDHRWLAVISGVAGGYANCRSNEIDQEYHDIAAFLQKTDDERERIIDADPEAYVGRFGNDAPVYTAAVYLDKRMNGRLALAESPAAFSPEAIHRSSVLDREILQALRDHARPEELAPVFQRLWRSEQSARGQADALVALVTVGQNVIPELAADLRESERATRTEAVLAHLERAAGFVAEPVNRARTAILADLEGLDEPDPETWIDIVDTALAALGASCARPVRYFMIANPITSALLERAPERYRPVLRADIFCILCDQGDNREYNTAVALDTIPEVDDFTAMLLHAHRAPSRRLGRLSLRWDVEPVPPRLDAHDDDIPLEALNALSTVHLGTIRPEFEIGFFETAIGKLAPRVDVSLELGPGLLGFALACGAFDIADVLARTFAGRPLRGITLRTEVERLGDPYHRARGWIAALPFVEGGDRDAVLGKAREDAFAITDAHRRTRVLEVLLTHATGVDHTDLHEHAVVAAHQVADPDNRCRALVRLARGTTDSERNDLWAEALAAAATIANEAERAETLQLLEPLLPHDHALEYRWDQVVQAISDPRLRARATNTLGLWLLREPPVSLAVRIRANPQFWGPVLLAAGLHDVLSKFQPDRTIVGLWTVLGNEPGSHPLVAEIVERGAVEGLPLTREAAVAVEALIHAGETESLHLLLPLLQTPTPSALPMVERWRTLPQPFIAHHATLLIAEDGRKINEHTIPSLAWMLAEGPDRSRARAHLTLRSRIWGAENIVPQLPVSRLGRRVVESLARLKIEFSDRDIRVNRVFNSMTADQLHDDPEAFRSWIAAAAGERMDARVARQILGDAFHLDNEVWPVFLEGLTGGHAETRRTLAKSVCMHLYIRNHLSPERAEELLKVLEKVSHDDFRAVQVFRDLENEVVRALVEGDLAKSTPPAQRSTVAARLLAGRATTLADLLSTQQGEELLGSLKALGDVFFSWLDGSDPQAETAAAALIDAPETFPTLVQWLTETLEADPSESEWYSLAGTLLRITATVARQMPTAFVKAADTRRLEPLLARAVSRERRSYARRGAILLLSHLRHVSVRVVRAMLFALRDDRHVQDAAFQAAEHFLEFQPAALTLLLNALRDESAVVAYGVSRMLVSICRNERIELSQRKEILEALASSVRGRSSQRGIYHFTGSGMDEDNAVKIGYFGRLDQAFHESILEIMGVVTSRGVRHLSPA